MSFLTRITRLLPRSITPARNYEPLEFAKYYPYGIRVTTGDALGITRAYSISENQQLFGINRYDGAEIAAVASVTPARIDGIAKLIEKQRGSTNAATLIPAQRALMDLINVHGQKPTGGLALVIALTELGAMKYNTIGFTDSPIVRVETFNH